MTGDPTVDPALRTWIDSANAPDCLFPIQNLPYGVFAPPGDDPRVGVAIGDRIADLALLEASGLLPTPRPVFGTGALNEFMALGPAVWSAVRAALSELLTTTCPTLRDDPDLRAKVFHPLVGTPLRMPFAVAGYTDFYAARQHAFNVGSMFRGPENALPPNWLHMPIGYNGRASTVVVSGTEVVRPQGQLKGKNDPAPRFGPCERLDFELELGAVVGTGSRMGDPVTLAEAEEMIFGFVLLNDWSARDIQVWEYQPLGPFLSKAFATSISPWVVPRQALAPFRTDPPPREVPLLPYLRDGGPSGYDIRLSVDLAPAGEETVRIAETNARHLYYTAAQQLTHHASSGCRMQTGDLLGSGTISGPGPGEYGSMLELAWNGTAPISVPGGSRTFLEDGDTVTLSGFAQGAGYRVGFGGCSGTVRPAPEIDWGTAR